MELHKQREQEIHAWTGIFVSDEALRILLLILLVVHLL
jgi:hypothetical protein